MDVLQQLGTALGIGLLSGIRLYLTVLGLGAAIRFHWIVLDSHQSGLAILADWRVMTAAGIACAIEFVADKIPWVDSVWDSIHTFIRPIGAIILGARAFMGMDPAAQMILAILCGGLALSGHSAKAATRLAANHSPEPFSNIALSLAGDAAVPVATWTAFHYPLVTLGFVAAFVLVFLSLGPRVFRAIRLELAALSAAVRSWFERPAGSGAAVPPITSLPPEFASALRPLPDGLRPAFESKAGSLQSDLGVRCAATKSVPCPNHLLGYLCVTGSDLVFFARGVFRNKVWRVPLSSIQKASWTSGMLLDKLYLTTSEGEVKFDILKLA